MGFQEVLGKMSRRKENYFIHPTLTMLQSGCIKSKLTQKVHLETAPVNWKEQSKIVTLQLVLMKHCKHMAKQPENPAWFTTM